MGELTIYVVVAVVDSDKLLHTKCTTYTLYIYIYGYSIVGQEHIYSNYISMLLIPLYVIVFMLKPAMPCYINIYSVLFCTLQVPNSISHVQLCCAIILNQCTVYMDQMQKLQQIVLFSVMYVQAC